LLFIGEGKDKNTLMQRINGKKELKEKIICLGKIPNEDLGHIIKQARVVITPSRSIFPEGFPKAAAEPLVLGIPVIAPNIGPFPFLIKHGYNGILFKKDSISSLSKSINKILDDEQLYYKLKSGAIATSRILIMYRCSFDRALKLTFIPIDRY
jgi:glycosyltransferase involved in cell wall biosynthesis